MFTQAIPPHCKGTCTKTFKNQIPRPGILNQAVYGSNGMIPIMIQVMKQKGKLD